MSAAATTRGAGETRGPGPQEDPHGSDRRLFPRFDVPAGALRARIGATSSSQTPAMVQDISRGGVRLELEERVFHGTTNGDCVVDFLDESGNVHPCSLRGQVRRAGLSSREFYLAVEFSRPLERLDIAALASAAGRAASV